MDKKITDLDQEIEKKVIDDRKKIMVTTKKTLFY